LKEVFRSPCAPFMIWLIVLMVMVSWLSFFDYNFIGFSSFFLSFQGI
jgi:hypothetical protein